MKKFLKIFMVLPMRSYQTEGRQENLENYIIPALKEIAEEQDLQVIDMNAFTTGHPDWFPDGLHPNDLSLIHILINQIIWRYWL